MYAHEPSRRFLFFLTRIKQVCVRTTTTFYKQSRAVCSCRHEQGFCLLSQVLLEEAVLDVQHRAEQPIHHRRAEDRCGGRRGSRATAEHPRDGSVGGAPEASLREHPAAARHAAGAAATAAGAAAVGFVLLHGGGVGACRRASAASSWAHAPTSWSPPRVDHRRWSRRAPARDVRARGGAAAGLLSSRRRQRPAAAPQPRVAACSPAARSSAAAAPFRPRVTSVTVSSARPASSASRASLGASPPRGPPPRAAAAPRRPRRTQRAA